ncbi:MAG: dephospho-CoA kinase [Treponema sp.]|nr:dephospho-CoA kinase [Treponema sp.]
MILCVTGPMAAGKNAAASILEQMGYACIDADLAGHKAVENAREKIFERFAEEAKKRGLSLMNEDGSVNRRALGEVVFSSPQLLQAHEAIVYPETERIIRKFIEENQTDSSIPGVVINAAVLYKTPEILRQVQFVLYVDAPLIMRYFRARKRDGLPTKKILERFASQKNLFAKYQNSNADIQRVWNTGSRRSLEKKILKVLAASAKGKK